MSEIPSSSSVNVSNEEPVEAERNENVGSVSIFVWMEFIVLPQLQILNFYVCLILCVILFPAISWRLILFFYLGLYSYGICSFYWIFWQRRRASWSSASSCNHSWGKAIWFLLLKQMGLYIIWMGLYIILCKCVEHF